MSDITDYIQTQWSDIHHSRQQDWGILLLLVGNLTALLVKDKIDKDYITVLLVSGLVIDLIGFYIAITHLIIFRSKMGKITLCEKKLDFALDEPRFNFRFKYGIISVQQMIMIIYAFIFSILITWLIAHLSNYNNDFLICFLIGLLFFIVLSFLCLYKNGEILTDIFVHQENDKPSDKFFYAPKKKIVDCLSYLDIEYKPIKLIAPSLFQFETEWVDSEWFFSVINNQVIDKKVLLNKSDFFQFSVASENSKQDKHVHDSTLEIYISDFEIGVYIKDNEETEINTPGIVIIPPGLVHKVKLSGLTYVVQINKKLFKIENDKIIIE
jgi:hypothetical protein